MSLKIKLADLSVLKSRLLVLDTTARREKYLAGDFSNSDKCKDLDKRYRWDLLHSSKLRIGDGIGVQGDLNLYGYLDDSHIDSALKSCIKPLQ